jgi:hypothetical protein
MSGLGDVTFYNDDVTVGMVMTTVTLTDAAILTSALGFGQYYFTGHQKTVIV